MIDEKQLLRAIAENKDSSALSQLYDHCAPAAYGLAVKILRNKAEADDILQQAFLSLWQHASEFDESKGRVSTWLYVFVRNRCIDLIRRKQNMPQVSIDSLDGTCLPSLLNEPSSMDMLERQQRNTDVCSALASIPDSQRLVIEAAYFHGLTQQEIAQKLNQPLGTIKTRMRLAMVKLAELLKDPEEAKIS